LVDQIQLPRAWSAHNQLNEINVQRALDLPVDLCQPIANFWTCVDPFNVTSTHFSPLDSPLPLSLAASGPSLLPDLRQQQGVPLDGNIYADLRISIPSMGGLSLCRGRSVAKIDENLKFVSRIWDGVDRLAARHERQRVLPPRAGLMLLGQHLSLFQFS
jgi:hypothetical protein